MNKLALTAIAAAAAAAIAVPAQADTPSDPGSQRSAQGKAHERGTANRGERGEDRRRGRCTPRKVGYVARGEYVSSTLTRTAGAATPELDDDRYSGKLVVAVKRTNRHARADSGKTKTYTLDNARVSFADRDGDETRDQPVAGDRVKVIGKITRLHRKCDQTGFEPQLTIRKVKFHKPRPVAESNDD